LCFDIKIIILTVKPLVEITLITTIILATFYEPEEHCCLANTPITITYLTLIITATACNNTAYNSTYSKIVKNICVQLNWKTYIMSLGKN